MIETAFHQLRFVYSILTGRPFSPGSLEQLVSAARQTVEEFGSIGTEGLDMINGPTLDEETKQMVQLRRFRSLAKRAMVETPYYRGRFAQLGIDPRKLTYQDIPRLPITSKDDLREQSDSFVAT